MHRTKILLLDKKGSLVEHNKRYGVYLDGELVVRIVCISDNPVSWRCEDLEGKRVSPTVFWKLAPRPQRQVAREWAIDYFDRRAELVARPHPLKHQNTY